MKRDKKIFELIAEEKTRQNTEVNLIASENYISAQVTEALGSVLNNKYAEGFPGRRYYAGNRIIDEIERLCQKRALKLFELSPTEWHVNVQPWSGSNANVAVYIGLLELHDKIMGMSLAVGGHLTHGHKASITGRLWTQIPYFVDEQTEMLDYDALAKLAKKERPKIIVCGYTAYSRVVDFKQFRKIADSVNAILMVDISHIAGLIAGKAYPSPFPYADVVTTTTHKTLRGPRAAMIFCKMQYQQKIDRGVFPRLQGGPHENKIAASAVALKEAMSPEFKKYAQLVIKNTKLLAEELQKLEWRIVSGGTDSHLFLVDTWLRGIPGDDAQDKLEKEKIIVNKNMIPFDSRSPGSPSGIRIGTAMATTLGITTQELKVLAKRINDVLLS